MPSAISCGGGWPRENRGKPSIEERAQALLSGKPAPKASGGTRRRASMPAASTVGDPEIDRMSMPLCGARRRKGC